MTVVASPRPKRWTNSEYRHLLEQAGADRLRYELIEGEIIEKPPQTDAHSYALSLPTMRRARYFVEDSWYGLNHPWIYRIRPNLNLILWW